jgi:hypothetical protein
MKHFEPGQPIVCRSKNNGVWNYSIYNRPSDTYSDIHITIDHVQISDKNILPFNEKTQHLVGKYINYTEHEPEPNTVIAVRDKESESWSYRLFLRKDDENRYVCLLDNTSYQHYLILPKDSTDYDAVSKRDLEHHWLQATSIEESKKN